MQSAAGGTSQRLNPALAMIRSRSRSPSPVPASPLVPATVVICVSPIFRGAAGALVMHGFYQGASQFNELGTLSFLVLPDVLLRKTVPLFRNMLRRASALFSCFPDCRRLYF